MPTATTVPTDTATPVPPLAVAQDGVTAWCVSFKDPNPLGGTADTPSYARMGKVVKGVLNLNVAHGTCTFVFTFNQALPAGTELQALNASGDQAWTKAALTPVSSNPKQGFATLNHPMLNSPSYWQVTYPFDLVASDGSILWKSNVLLYKTFPGLCWEGSTPDPVTLFLPAQRYRFHSSLHTGARKMTPDFVRTRPYPKSGYFRTLSYVNSCDELLNSC